MDGHDSKMKQWQEWAGPVRWGLYV